MSEDLSLEDFYGDSKWDIHRRRVNDRRYGGSGVVSTGGVAFELETTTDTFTTNQRIFTLKEDHEGTSVSENGTEFCFWCESDANEVFDNMWVKFDGLVTL